MRRVLMFGGIAVAVVLAAAITLLLFVDVNQFREPIQAQLQSKLGRPVSLGSMGLRLFPLSIRVDDAVIGESPSFPTGRPFATAKELRVSVGLLPLLRKRVQVDSLLLREPSIELVKNATGRWNFADLGGSGGGGGGTGGGFDIGRVEIQDASIAVSGLGKPASRAVYDHIGLTLASSGPEKTLTLTVGKTPIHITGSMDPSASSVKARLTVSDADLADLLALADGGVSGSGSLSLDARVEGPLDSLSYAGSGSLRNASIKSATLTKPVEIRSADLKLENKTLTLSNLVCSLGGSTLRGSASARNFSAPDVGFKLDIDKLDLGELQQLTAGSKSGGGGGEASTGQLTAKGAITVGSIVYGNLRLDHVRSDCSLSRGVLTLAPLTAEVYGGKQSGSITLDTRARPPRVAFNTKLEGVDADKLLSATTSLKKTLYGLLAASGDASMSLVPGGDVTRTLNGNLSLNLTKGRLEGINVLNQIAALGKFVGYTQRSEPFTDIVQLTGDVKVRDGVASTDNLRFQMDGGTVASTGTVNLADQSLNLRLTAVLDREMSQKVGGSRIGGLLTTALASGNGELVIPAVVTGTFARPRFLPDAARIAEMKLSGMAGRKGAASSILDKLTGKPASQGGGLLGILDSLDRKDEKSGQKKP
jgi:AsmA protein